jgi:uncharacterized protein YigE (DUF2233 family)
MRWRWRFLIGATVGGLALLPFLSLSRAVRNSDSGFSARQLEYAGRSYTVVTADLSRVQLKLFWKDEAGKKLGTLSNLETYLKRNHHELLAGMNAGIFDAAFTPLGLHVERGRTLHPLKTRRKGYGNFYLQPNAVFYLDKLGAHIIDTLSYADTAPNSLEATQSGPALVLRGKINASFQAGSPNRLTRNGIGVENAKIVHLVVGDDWVNFDEFARLFRDALHCPDALYLDGNISKLRVPGSRDDDGEFAGMIGVIRP